MNSNNYTIHTLALMPQRYWGNWRNWEIDWITQNDEQTNSIYLHCA